MELLLEGKVDTSGLVFGTLKTFRLSSEKGFFNSKKINKCLIRTEEAVWIKRRKVFVIPMTTRIAFN